MFEAIKNLGTTLFYQPLFNLLFWFVAILPGESLGLGIIALTIFIRALLIPSNAAAIRSQREMAALQPKVDEIRKKYSKDPEEMNKRLLGIYQEHNVNPFGSCLPLLIQLPILWVLYRVFLNGVHPDNFDLLYSFVPAPDQITTIFLGVNLEAPSLVFALVAGGLQFFQTRQIMARQQRQKDQQQLPKGEQPKKDKDPAEAAQQMTSKMIYFMPLLTVFIAATLPSALAVYWIVTTIFSIGQQWYLIKHQPALKHDHVSVSVKTRKK